MQNRISSRILLNKAKASVKKKEWKDAAIYYNSYLSICPEDRTAWASLGLALFRDNSNKIVEIKHAFEMALRIKHDDPFILVKYGNTLWALGEFEIARKCFLKAIDSGRSFSFPFWSYANFVQAVDKDNLAALFLFKKAVEAEPMDSYALFYYGRILLAIDRDKGMQHLRKSASMNNERAIEYLDGIDSH